MKHWIYFISSIIKKHIIMFLVVGMFRIHYLSCYCDCPQWFQQKAKKHSGFKVRALLRGMCDLFTWWLLLKFGLQVIMRYLFCHQIVFLVSKTGRVSYWKEIYASSFQFCILTGGPTACKNLKPRIRCHCLKLAFS